VLTRALYDLTPTPRDLGPPPPRHRELPTTPDLAGGLADLIVGAVRQQNAMLRAVPHVMSAIADALAPPVARDAKIRDIVPKLEIGETPQIIAPKTIFNVAIGPERTYAARSVSLGAAKKAAKANGATLNDVVMSACGGALRRYLAQRKALPPRSLIAAVPVSLRAPGNTDMTNQVSMMTCPIGTHIGDPIARLKAVQRSSSVSKGFLSKIKDVIPQDFTFLGAPVILSGFANLFSRLKAADYMPPVVNVLISNVPGPPVALYCASAKVSALYPVSIPAHGGALNITVQSYVDHLDFAITACAKAVPDVDVLADLIVEAFDELNKATAENADAEPVVAEANKKPGARARKGA
jgi:WS/DGAT/MGAT family acyltransferase